MLRQWQIYPPVSGLRWALRIGFSYGLIAGNGAVAAVKLQDCEVWLRWHLGWGKLRRNSSAIERSHRKSWHAMTRTAERRYLKGYVCSLSVGRIVCDEPLRHRAFAEVAETVYILDDINEEIRIGG